MWSVVLITGIVYLIYILFGGGIFMLLENLYKSGMKGVYDANISAMFTDMEKVLLENFTESDIKSVVMGWKSEKSKYFFSNETNEIGDVQWTYNNAFFFVFHLCSTIGYGDVVPSTVIGQALAIVFTLLGIPLHILFLKILGESFALSYQETMLKIKGNKHTFIRQKLGNLGFFLPWTIIFFVVPSVVFMFTEDWNFTEGFYYSFITLTTVGLGDYVAAGSEVSNEITFTLYKLAILTWMIYGLAFVSLVVDFMTYLFQMYLLFSFKCDTKKCTCKFERVYMDIEKMDVHFKLLRAEAVKQPYSMWSVREDTRLAIGFRSNHMYKLASLCERIEGELIELLDVYEPERSEVLPKGAPVDAFPVRKAPVDAFPVRKAPVDAFPVRKAPKDAFPVKKLPEDGGPD